MMREHDRRDDQMGSVGEESMGDRRPSGVAGADVAEDGASGGAPGPPSVHAGRRGADGNQGTEPPAGRKSPFITTVEIENFKGIGRPVHVELRPITLLFGRNSAGKSTVLHALCYAHEILSHRNVDAHRTDLGGDQIDLGGFRQFVHRHDCTQSVRFRFELKLRNRELPDLEGWGTQVPVTLPTGDMPQVEDRDILSDAEAGWLELGVEWNVERSEPIVNRYEVGVDGLLLGRITRPAPTGKALLVANLSHPLLEYGIDMQDSDRASRAVGQVREAGGSAEYGQDLYGMTVLSAPSSALPSLRQMLWVTGDGAFGDLDQHSRYRLSALLPGIGSLVRDELAGFRYLGPLRDLHPGGGAEGGMPGSGRWADGSAAWELLNRHARVNVDQDTQNLIAAPRPGHKVMSAERLVDVSDWLSRQDRLDTGYKLRVDRTLHLGANAPLVGVLNKGVEGEKWGAPILAELAGISGAETADDVVRGAPDKVAALLDRIAKAPVHREIQLVSTRTDLPVRTSDIGVGISQLLPVVVAVLDPDRPGITAIEQPELHVHPRLQVELGDLFAEGAAGGSVFLIETHSEHLLLRIMRRMRETSVGTLPEGVPEVRPEDVNVLFVEQDGAETLIREMPLNEKGELVKAWPGGFFEEDLREIF